MYLHSDENEDISRLHIELKTKEEDLSKERDTIKKLKQEIETKDVEIMELSTTRALLIEVGF